MGLYRYQFSGIMATPALVTSSALFSKKNLHLEEAYHLILDNLKDFDKNLNVDKSIIKALKTDLNILSPIATPDIIYGYTYNGQTGITKEVLHGQLAIVTNYTQEQFEQFTNIFNHKKQQVESLVSILLNQPVVFPLLEKENFEYWI